MFDSTWSLLLLETDQYEHHNVDIRDRASLSDIFAKYGSDIKLVVHTAACPSHDWAAKEPLTDFSVNALGTMHLLERTRNFCPKAVFIFTSTNKVYGDTPNELPLVELETRMEIDRAHSWYTHGITEYMSIDHCKHSLFGVSKVAADVMVQEYGKYFGMNTVVFRGGCLTGPHHSGTMLHGFLSYLVKCIMTGREYTVFGRKGKTVRDNIHASDIVNAFFEVYKKPCQGEVFNLSGGRFSNCSMLEAIQFTENLTGKKANLKFIDEARIGDHIWYIGSMEKFKRAYPNWKQVYNIDRIITDIVNFEKEKQS